MAHWPLQTGVARQLSTMRFATSGAVETVTLTADATPHTKGAWTEIIASTFGGVRLLGIELIGPSAGATDTATLLDLAIGGAGSEVVIFENCNLGALDASGPSNRMYLPLAIPDGSRIAGRIQAVVASETVTVSMDTYGGSGLNGAPPVGVAVDTYGANTATSRGVSVVTGSSSVFGAWTEVAASIPNPIRAVWFTIGLNGETTVNHVMTTELGVGPAGSEQPLMAMTVGFASNESHPLLHATPPALHAVPIPAGQRLSVRAKANTNNKSTDVIVHGLR